MNHLLSVVQNVAIDYKGPQYNKGMKIFTRANTNLRPYAASSTGSYRGLLAQKYPCWDAHGPAREVFLTEIAGKIKHCLEQCLPESNAFIGYSLFMVGKSPDKTKPYIMMVSDDKPRRKAAFKIIKSQEFMAKHPGFELGHCSVAAEFEDLQQLGEGLNDTRDSVSDSALTAMDSELMSSLTPCATQPASWSQPTKIGFHTPTGQHRGSGTCGGLFTYKDRLYCFTVAHALHHMPKPIDNTSGSLSVSSSDSDDCEMTGMEDWDDDEGDDNDAMTAVASESSRRPFENPDNKDDLVDNHDSPSPFEDDDILETTPSRMVRNSRSMDGADLNRDANAKTCERIGSIVGIERDLDLAIMRMEMSTSESVQSYEELLKLSEDYEYDMNETSVFIKTNHDAEIYGRRSKTPVYMRLPGTRTFQLLYNIKFKVPIQAGDCGSWVFNEASRQLVGFVVAGSPRTGWCLVSPARVALEKMIALLEGLSNPGPSMAPRVPTLSMAPRVPTPSMAPRVPTPPPIVSVRPAASTPRGNAPGFLPVETNGHLFYARTTIQIIIEAVLGKAFFFSEGEWVCSRREYFSCDCSYKLIPANYHPPIMYLPNGEHEAHKVSGFAISISAVVSDNECHSIDLVLHTSEEDRPASSPGKIRLSPKPPQEPQILPERTAEPSKLGDFSQMYSEEHTFDRVQFTRATAGNDACQESQEYFHLVVDLYADISAQESDQKFVKIASRKSEKLIVRGLSPSHYPAERPGHASQGPGGSGERSETISQYSPGKTTNAIPKEPLSYLGMSRESDNQGTEPLAPPKGVEET